MKKIFTLIALAFVAISINAKDVVMGYYYHNDAWNQFYQEVSTVTENSMVMPGFLGTGITVTLDWSDPANITYAGEGEPWVNEDGTTDARWNTAFGYPYINDYPFYGSDFGFGFDENLYIYGMYVYPGAYSYYVENEDNPYIQTTLYTYFSDGNATYDYLYLYTKVYTIADEDTVAAPVVAPAKPLIYNLQGQKVVTPRKGLNIINGRKVVVK